MKYKLVEIDGVLHSVRDMGELFAPGGAYIPDDVPVALDLDVDVEVPSISEQMRKMFERERAAVLARMPSSEEAPEDEDDFHIPDETYLGTSSDAYRSAAIDLLEKAQEMDEARKAAVVVPPEPPKPGEGAKAPAPVSPPA